MLTNEDPVLLMACFPHVDTSVCSLSPLFLSWTLNLERTKMDLDS